MLVQKYSDRYPGESEKRKPETLFDLQLDFQPTVSSFFIFFVVSFRLDTPWQIDFDRFSKSKALVIFFSWKDRKEFMIASLKELTGNDSFDFDELARRGQISCPTAPALWTNGEIELSTHGITIKGMVEGLMEGVPSADFLLLQDIGNRLVLVLGDVKGKGFTPSEDGIYDGYDPFEVARSAVDVKRFIIKVISESSENLNRAEKPAEILAKKIYKEGSTSLQNALFDCVIVVVEQIENKTSLHICIGGALGVWTTDDRSQFQSAPMEYRSSNFSYIGDSGATFCQHELVLSSRGACVLHTDGFAEPLDSEVFHEMIQMSFNRDSESIRTRLQSHIKKEFEMPRNDDTSLLIILPQPSI